MNKFLSAFAVTAILAVTTIIPATAGTLGNNYWMKIVNNSSYVIDELYASNRDDTSWGRNILPRTLYPGQSVEVNVDDYSGYCIYDLMAEGTKGSEWEDYGVNVCEQYLWNLYD